LKLAVFLRWAKPPCGLEWRVALPIPLAFYGKIRFIDRLRATNTNSGSFMI